MHETAGGGPIEVNVRVTATTTRDWVYTSTSQRFSIHQWNRTVWSTLRGTIAYVDCISDVKETGCLYSVEAYIGEALK